MAKTGLQVKPLAPVSKVVGVFKGLVISEGGPTVDGGQAGPEDFVHATSPMMAVSITYYSKELAGGRPTPGGN